MSLFLILFGRDIVVRICESTPLAQRDEGRYVQISACHVAERMPCGDRGVLVMNHMQEITSGMGSL